MFGMAPDGRIFQTARGGILQDSGYNEVWNQARKTALTPARYRSPLGRRPYDLRHAAVSLWLNSGVPATEVARRAGHGVAVLLKIYAHCIDGQSDAANKRITDALGIQDTQPESEPGDEKDDDSEQHPEMPGQRQEAGRTVSVTAPPAPSVEYAMPPARRPADLDPLPHRDRDDILGLLSDPVSSPVPAPWRDGLAGRAVGIRAMALRATASVLKLAARRLEP
jgi:hypothetical protein